MGFEALAAGVEVNAVVPRIRFHNMRHCCGTLLHVQGADPFIIHTVLGHSQLSTKRRYTHAPVEVTRPALTGLESMFSAAGEKRQADLVTNSPTSRKLQQP
jgi:integrase